MSGRHADLLRRAYPGALAKLHAATRSLHDAEDALHDAIARALDVWPREGVPEVPEAWLVAVALNRHRDRARRRAVAARHEGALAALAEMSPWARAAMGELRFARGWKDELLGLLFACCDPALAPGEAAALALTTVVGLSTEEAARAFLVAPRSMEQRLTRARQRLRERSPGDAPSPDASADRLDAVLRALYLLFNEGYWSGDDEAPIRADLCALAVGLTRSLAEVAAEAPEVRGLLAVLLLHDARRPARLDAGGAPVPLPDQDRSRWDRAAVTAAVALLDDALAERKPGPFQVEAAIAAVHCRAPTAEATDWREIEALYGLLESMRPTSTVRAQRAFATARAEGVAAGLAMIEAGGAADEAPLVYGALLAEAGRDDEARRQLTRALDEARNRHERAQIAARLAALTDGRDTT
ncbi:MAG: DUF6596 domain-containing protein [Polyangiales bacterium]